ncbi:unnamed protein product [Leptidea sinapis]|uniref:Uncharacterized protein n=1 Tax=Leptidea sinapis TaxID=189913 RepID=A0A5E4Q301_9NEOP|nr:unnamed protein product [Leptidea sinapis]
MVKFVYPSREGKTANSNRGLATHRCVIYY